MKDIVLSVFVIIFVFLLFTGVCARPEIIGVWKSGVDTLEFSPPGKCRIEGKNAFFRILEEGKVAIYDSKDFSVYAYMISFDNKSMYFDAKRYERSLSREKRGL